jgi:hypothetical protein
MPPGNRNRKLPSRFQATPQPPRSIRRRIAIDRKMPSSKATAKVRALAKKTKRKIAKAAQPPPVSPHASESEADETQDVYAGPGGLESDVASQPASPRGSLSPPPDNVANAHVIACLQAELDRMSELQEQNLATKFAKKAKAAEETARKTAAEEALITRLKKELLEKTALIRGDGPPPDADDRWARNFAPAPASTRPSTAGSSRSSSSASSMPFVRNPFSSLRPRTPDSFHPRHPRSDVLDDLVDHLSERETHGDSHFQHGYESSRTDGFPRHAPRLDPQQAQYFTAPFDIPASFRDCKGQEQLQSGQIGPQSSNPVIASGARDALYWMGTLEKFFAPLSLHVNDVMDFVHSLAPSHLRDKLLSLLTPVADGVYNYADASLANMMVSQVGRMLEFTDGSSAANKFHQYNALASTSTSGSHLEKRMQSVRLLALKCAPQGTKRQHDANHADQGSNRDRGAYGKRPRPPILQAYCSGCQNRNVSHTADACLGITRGARPPPASSSTGAPATGPADPK